MATLITGASSGIGEEFAHHYAAEKHDLVLVARSEDKLNTLADTLRSQHGIQVTVIALDLSEPDAAQRLWEETNRARLEIDVLVNNAGFGTHGDVADDNPDRLEQEVRLNCLTLTGLTARYLPTMRERKTGTIINIASTAAFQPLPHMAVYGATKHLCCPLPKRSGQKPEKTASECSRSAPAPPTPHSLKSPVNPQRSGKCVPPASC